MASDMCAPVIGFVLTQKGAGMSKTRGHREKNMQTILSSMVAEKRKIGRQVTWEIGVVERMKKESRWEDEDNPGSEWLPQ